MEAVHSEGIVAEDGLQIVHCAQASRRLVMVSQSHPQEVEPTRATMADPPPVFIGAAQCSGSDPHRLRASEKLFAFLDDIYVVSEPGRVGPIYQVLEAELWRRVGIRIHAGKRRYGMLQECGMR